LVVREVPDTMLTPLLARFLQLVPITMELVAPIKSQRLYLIVGTDCKKRASGETKNLKAKDHFKNLQM